jgi:ribosome biogenesis protein SSF1/2
LDIRKMMRPYTAVKLKEDAKNRKMKLQDYAAKLTSALGVTHILALSQNESRIFLRVARCQNGPTLTFQIQQFSLTKHVVASQKRPYYTPSMHDHSSLVVSNNFGDASASPHVKLMRITFQALFPAIKIATINLSECKRVVLFNLIRRTILNADKEEEEEEVVEVRHYGIKASPVGIDRKVRRLIQANAPNLSRCKDISEYILGKGGGDSTGALSDSEAEDETSHVVLPQRYHGRGNAKHQKAALKLIELGPRMCLKLVKIERGLASGDVMYHAFHKKTPEEVNAQRMKFEQAAQLRRQRREDQEANVAKKKEQLASKKRAEVEPAENNTEFSQNEFEQHGSGDDGDSSDESEDDSDEE